MASGTRRTRGAAGDGAAGACRKLRTLRRGGAPKVEFIGGNAIRGQLDCVKKAQQGIVDPYSASTQNSAGTAPYFDVLDFAYMFPSRASRHHTSVEDLEGTKNRVMGTQLGRIAMQLMKRIPYPSRGRRRSTD